MECLHSLANTECFGILQGKLNNWRAEFEGNCTESNISRCCELLELNAKVQAQLFKLLGLCAIQGNFHGSETKIKDRLLPYFGDEYLSQGLTSNVVMDILSDVSCKVKRLSKKQNHHKKKCHSKERSNSQDIPTTIDNDHDPQNKRKKHSRRENKNKNNNIVRSQSFPTFSDNVEEIKNMEAMQPLEGRRNSNRSDITAIINDSYLQDMVGQYNDLFSESRASSMEILKQHVDDHENSQRIIFALIMTTAKNVSDVQRSLKKPYGLKDGDSRKLEFRNSVSGSILKSLRARIIYELINGCEGHQLFYFPGKFHFSEMENFLDRTIELFWNFGGVNNGIQLLEASDGELFDEHRYRRSYDSDFSAPLINHHIWPCLAQGKTVLVKGEACTRAYNRPGGAKATATAQRNSTKQSSL